MKRGPDGARSASKRPRPSDAGDADQASTVCPEFDGPCALGSRCPFVHPGVARARRLPPAFRLGPMRGLPRALSDDLASIADVFRGDWTHALLSTAYLDLNWLLSAVPRLQHVPSQMLHQDVMEGAPPSRMELIQPLPELPSDSRARRGISHSKFAILFFETGVRFALFSANFHAVEWAEATNGVFQQDFPLAAAPGARLAPFGADLCEYLRAVDGQRLAPALAQLALCDFSSARAALVGHVPGIHRNEALYKWGHMRLRRLLQRAKLPLPESGTQLAMQGSSLGLMSPEWMEEMQQSMLGAQAAPRGGLRRHVVWPSREQVRDSTLGAEAGGFMAFGNEWYQKQKRAVDGLLSAWDASGSGLGRKMPHLKSYVRFHEDYAAAAAPRVDWCLLTSANFTKSAWGALKNKNRDALQITNFELGVLLLPGLMPADPQAPEFQCSGEGFLLPQPARVDQELGDTGWGLPIPYALPPRRYKAGESPFLNGCLPSTPTSAAGSSGSAAGVNALQLQATIAAMLAGWSV